MNLREAKAKFRCMAMGLLTLVGAVCTCSSSLAAGLDDVETYFIGRDKMAVFTSGAYNGLPNPNFNRLTLLLGHGSHYHAKSSYVYTGAQPNQQVRAWPNGFFLPEDRPAFDLVAGTGAFAGKNRSGFGAPGEEQWDFRIRAVDHLSSFNPGDPELVLFNSSSGRWNTPISGNNIWLHLHSISPELKVADQLGNILLQNAGDSVALGSASLMDFTPVMFVDQAAPMGTYFARFILSEFETLGGATDSGQFEFRFNQVPEPASSGLVLIGMLAASGLRRRRQR
ncbi:MAG: PEP-CTERM sorting domain-containing protein [Pirellulaceae bacterium]|nr:PEP-CTERM sorting domain-containing protein [Pirellulaceae bacterium]